jgi:hypothetical protein
MSIKYVKWHKQVELESLASQLHAQYQVEVPVDIDYLVEMMEIDICDISRLKEDFGLFGCLGKVKGKFVIFVQRGDFKVTNYYTNFTIAEELSHFILHKEYFKNVKDFNEAFEFYTKITQKSEMMIELNAKYLAGAILLPREHLKRKAEEVYKQNASMFNEILKNGSQDNCETIIAGISSYLTDIYQVPDGAIAFRLKTKAIGFREFLKDKYNGKCD